VGSIALHERSENVLRCAICHDEPLPLVPCSLCQSVFHEDCRAALGRCPTPGCVPRLLVSERRPLAWRRILTAGLVAGSTTAALASYLGATDRSAGNPGDADLKIAFGVFAVLLSLHFVIVPGSSRTHSMEVVLRAGGVCATLVLAALIMLALTAASGSGAAVWSLAAGLIVAIPTIASSMLSREPVEGRRAWR
jgi:hypothetical protein